MTVSIYGSWYSTCTQACMTAVAEKNAKVDLVSIDLSKGEHKQETHLKRQPFGKIPVLTDGNFSMFESRAIVRYINEKYGSQGNLLIPTTLDGSGLLNQWCSLEHGTINPLLTTILSQRIWGPMFYNQPTDESKIKQAVKDITLPLDVLEKHLSQQNRKYVVGDQYTIVDIYFSPYLSLLNQTPEKTLISERPALAAYFKRLMERPSWVAVIKNTQPSA